MVASIRPSFNFSPLFRFFVALDSPQNSASGEYSVTIKLLTVLVIESLFESTALLTRAQALPAQMEPALARASAHGDVADAGTVENSFWKVKVNREDHVPMSISPSSVGSDSTFSLASFTVNHRSFHWFTFLRPSSVATAAMRASRASVILRLFLL